MNIIERAKQMLNTINGVEVYTVNDGKVYEEFAKQHEPNITGHIDDDIPELPFEPANVSDVEQDRDNNGLDDFEPDPFQEEHCPECELSEFRKELAEYHNEGFTMGVPGEDIVIDDSNVYSMLRMTLDAGNSAAEQCMKLKALLDMYKLNLEVGQSVVEELQADKERLQAEVENLEKAVEKASNDLIKEKNCITAFLRNIDNDTLSIHTGFFGGKVLPDTINKFLEYPHREYREFRTRYLG